MSNAQAFSMALISVGFLVVVLVLGIGTIVRNRDE